MHRKGNLRRCLLSVGVIAGFSLGIFAAHYPSEAHAQGNAQRNAAVGGIAGAVLGGVAGKQDNRTTRGAVIGGVAGAVAGNWIGRAQDDQIRRLDDQARRQYEYEQYRLAQNAYHYQRSVSISDVIEMTRNGVSPQLMISQIRMSGVQQEIGVNEIIQLHQNGVKESVIQEMQRARVGGPDTHPQQRSGGPPRTVVGHPDSVIYQPVIPAYGPAVGVEYHYYSTPRPRYSHPHYYNGIGW